jgi:hypothetical protein
MPFSLAIPSHGVLVAHAGIVPGVPLERQRLTDLINVRSSRSYILSKITKTSMWHVEHTSALPA